MTLSDIVKRGVLRLAASTVALSSILGCSVLQPRPVRLDLEHEVIDAFEESSLPEMNRRLEGKQLALALLTPEDQDDRDKERLEENFQEIPQYEVFTGRPKTISDLLNFLRDYAKVKPIDALILEFHGTQDSFRVTPDTLITTRNVYRLFEGYSDCFSKDAIIILYSCSTGKGSTNIATELSDVLNRDVVSPRLDLFSEKGFPPNLLKLGEFALTEDGRVSFDYNDFTIFDWIVYRDEEGIQRAHNVVGSKSYLQFNGVTPRKKPATKEEMFLLVDK